MKFKRTRKHRQIDKMRNKKRNKYWKYRAKTWTKYRTR